MHTRCYVGLYICLYSTISLFPGCRAGSQSVLGHCHSSWESRPPRSSLDPSPPCSNPASALRVRGWGARGGRARGGNGEGTEAGGKEAVWDAARPRGCLILGRGALKARRPAHLEGLGRWSRLSETETPAARAPSLPYRVPSLSTGSSAGPRRRPATSSGDGGGRGRARQRRGGT